MNITIDDLNQICSGVLRTHDGLEAPPAIALAYINLVGNLEPDLVLSRQVAAGADYRWSVLALGDGFLLDIEMTNLRHPRDVMFAGPQVESTNVVTVANLHRLGDIASLSLSDIAISGFGSTWVATPSWQLRWNDDTTTVVSHSSSSPRAAETEAIARIVDRVRQSL